MERLRVIGLIAAGVALIAVAAVLGGRPAEGPASLHRPEREPLSNSPTPTRAPQATTQVVAGTSAPKKAAGTASPTASKSRVEWYRAFQNPSDLVALVREASAAAERGDDGAAWQLFNLMFHCAPIVRAIRSGTTEDAYLERYSALPPGYAQHQQDIYRQCAGLATAKELADWDVSGTGRMGAKYWRQLAMRLGNPVARAESVISNAYDRRRFTPERREQSLAQARTEVKAILRSRDGEAWYELGMSLGTNALAKDLTLGYAIALASCDLGYDCSGEHERADASGCRREGSCLNLEDRLKMSMSPELYARSYAKYQELAELLKRGAWDEIDQYTPLDGLLFKGGALPWDTERDGLAAHPANAE